MALSVSNFFYGKRPLNINGSIQLTELQPTIHNPHFLKTLRIIRNRITTLTPLQNTILYPEVKNVPASSSLKSTTYPIYDDNSSVAPTALNILSSFGLFSPELVTEYPLSPSRVNTVQARVPFLKIHHTPYIHKYSCKLLRNN